MFFLSLLVTLFLGVAAIYAIGVVLAVALLALIEAYNAVKKRIVHSHYFKVAKILIKRLNNKVEQVVVVLNSATL